MVGESGCGKSTLGRLLLCLEAPTAGEVRWRGRVVTGLRESALREFRRRVQIVFQDPTASLNPRQTVGAAIAEPLANFGFPRQERAERVAALLPLVGLTLADAARYPHELSGGQRQRVALARALALEPELIVLDEALANLDVSIRAQILNLLRELKKRLNLSYLFISHDLAAVGYLADRVAVMYLGKIVEVLPAAAIVARAHHPYTRALLASLPVPDPRRCRLREPPVKGEPPDPANPPTGCRFHPRCPEAREECRRVEPVLEEVERGFWVACLNFRQYAAGRCASERF